MLRPPTWRGQLRIWAGAIFMASLLATALTLTAEAQTPTPTPPPSIISVSPTSGPPQSTSIIVFGSNFAASQSVSIRYDNSAVGNVSSGSGTWSFSFSVPASASGPHTVRATAGAQVATANFDVTPIALMAITSGPHGLPVGVTGRGFGASQSGIA
ncbi:MAG: hypothetical protein HW397_627, partial [Dehalococcoidia bacterium]|nr:hypothetical protein [Dehalococcoidia bacterium]